MPSSPTLLDILKKNGSDDVVGLIDESIKAIPEVTLGAARDIKGIQYKTRVRISLPTVGFRNVNEGVDSETGKIENRLVEAYLMNPRWDADKALADVDEDGPELYLADEGVAMVTAGFITIGSQFYYGKTMDANKGFPGLISAVDPSLVLDATGTTEDTCSSLWGVRWGRQDVTWVWGNGAKLELSPVRLGDKMGVNGKPYTAYIQEMVGRPGLQVGSKFSVGRIKKLTEDPGKGLTDALIATFLAKFPVAKKPDVLFCTQRSLMQLQKSRTATNATGAPAPIPTESFNIPIYPTDSLTNTEKLAL